MARDTLPAISESEASGEIAELYADIRTTPDVSAPNRSVPFDAALTHLTQLERHPMHITGTRLRVSVAD